MISGLMRPLLYPPSIDAIPLPAINKLGTKVKPPGICHPLWNVLPLHLWEVPKTVWHPCSEGMAHETLVQPACINGPLKMYLAISISVLYLMCFPFISVSAWFVCSDSPVGCAAITLVCACTDTSGLLCFISYLLSLSLIWFDCCNIFIGHLYWCLSIRSLVSCWFASCNSLEQ